HVPLALREVPQEFRHRYGEVFSEYNRFAFDRETARRKDGLFVAPGHPLLESVLERVLERGADDLRKGALFADPDGQLDGYLWFLEGEVHDGTGEVVGRRLFALFQSADGGDPRPVNSSVLWDLLPLPPAAEAQPPPSEEPVIARFAETELEAYRAELLRERERHAEIRRRYGLRSLDGLILESQARLIAYETRRAKGEPVPEVEVRNEERRKEELLARRRDLEEEIRRQTALLPATPHVLGVARVVPQAPEPGMREDPAVEAVGMRVALAYEWAQGRLPQDVSAQNLGYDIRSEAPDGTVRYIEVKARAQTGPVVLTPNEWLMARRLGEEYWLYVVEHAATEPALYPIQNPAAKLRPEVVQTVRFVVKQWKASAHPSGTSSTEVVRWPL
ncbi:MAG: DUF3883 domain-containing protein, partial [Anaerolineae bacterium]